jgi:hypothetical protein
MKRSLAVFVLLLASNLLLGQSVSGAEIIARISPVPPPPAGEPFQLILETAETPGGKPDFSVLTRDFEILHRSRSQRTRSRNGRISRQTSWRLTLLERTGKARGVPPIPFGNDLSNPVPIKRQRTTLPRESSLRPALPVPLPRTLTSLPLQVPKVGRAPVPERASQPSGATAPSTTEAPERSPWSLLLAAIPGAVLLLVWWQQRRRRQRSPNIPDTVTKEDIPTSEAEALRKACRMNDAEAAARALMQWANQRWPDSPPAHIGPLARRFAGTDVELEIRKLEQVLYSPDEKSWQGSLLWQVMKDLVPQTLNNCDQTARINRQEQGSQ